MPGEKIAEKLTSYLRKKQESKSSNTYEPLSDAHAGILTFFWKQRPLEIRTDGQVTHTVPRRISGSVGFKLSLRVREPRENCTIEVFQGNRVIGMRRMKRASPAEMIQIPIGADKLNTEQGLEVRIS